MINVDHNNSASQNYLGNPIFAISLNLWRWVTAMNGRPATPKEESKHSRVCIASANAACGLSLQDASVHIRAPLSSISQENKNNKSYIQPGSTRKSLCTAAKRDAQRKELQYTKAQTQLTVN